MDFEFSTQLKRFAAPTVLAGACCWFSLLVGCQSLKPKNDSPWDPGKTEGDVRLASAKQPADSKPTSDVKLMDYLTGNSARGYQAGRDLYQQGDSLFKKAAAEDKENAAADTFSSAAKMFAKAVKALPGSALEQDAMFMQAESLFFANRLTDAAETYQLLQKNHPRNRHNDTIAARLFAISQYWIDTAHANEDSWLSVNITDAKRPAYDSKGHAIRVLDQIRYDDPTGKLADDATMAAAAEHFRQGEYEKADEFLTDLRETFTDSDHLFTAHLLGIQAKLQVYAGPAYNGLALREAEKLVTQTRTRFPDRMREREFSDMLAKASAEIAIRRAERLEYRASGYREKRGEYGAAREHYQRLIEQFPNTPQAERARKRIAEIKDLPAKPAKPLGFLEKVFPDKRSKSPSLVLKSEVPRAAPAAGNAPQNQ